MTDRGGVLALVPVRGLRAGKTRLAGDLAPEAREALTRRMLRGVVRAALDSGAVEAVGVISPDAAALDLAARLDPAVVPLPEEPSAPGLNAALEAGRAWAIDAGAAALLVLFGDLPLLTAGDVRGLAERDAAVVLAQDRHGAGTNALLLRLDGAAVGFRFGFGAGSFARHLAEAKRLGLSVAVVDGAGTAVDLDTPEDWRLVLEAESENGRASVLVPAPAGGEGERA